MATIVFGIIFGILFILLGIFKAKTLQGKVLLISLGGFFLIGIAVVLYFVSTLNLGPGPGYGDFNFKINTDYSIQKSSAHQIVMYGKKDGKTQVVIEAKIVALDFNTKHIIVKQQHMVRKYPNNPDNTYMEPKPESYSFWIVNKNMKEVHGPFSEEEFIREQEQMGVADTLKFKDVHSFKPKK